MLDANILIRAVLAQCVRHIVETHAENISFFVPEAAYAEAEEHLSALVVRRGGDPMKALAALKAMTGLSTITGNDGYGDFEEESRKRLGTRDPEDWPILAAALAVGCPIWTQDTDLFGCGVATWTSASIALLVFAPLLVHYSLGSVSTVD